MKIALDTNCVLEAVDEGAHAHRSMCRILEAGRSGQAEIYISRHSLTELSREDRLTQAARELAAGFSVLPHYPIGPWAEQVATWDETYGTWGDVQRNEKIQRELAYLAKSGSDLRDRGAYLDALHAGVDVFVTSDKQLVGSRPAARIHERFRLRVSTPADLAELLRPPTG